MAASSKGIQIGQPFTDNGTIVLDDRMADLIAETGARWIRLHFRRGPFASILDNLAELNQVYHQIVDRLMARKIQVIGLLSYETVAGGQAQWIENSFERTHGDGYNTYIDRFVQAFEAIVNEFDVKVRYWELWNEPNAWSVDPSQNELPGGTFIFPSNFAALLTECHARVHHFNQLDVQIISGGLFGHSIGGFSRGSAGAEYLDQTYETGIHGSGKFAWAKATYGMYPIDIIGQHVYLDADDVGTWFERYVNWIAGVVQAREPTVTKKIFMTEYGWQYNTKLTGATRDSQERKNADALETAGAILAQHGAIQSACYFNLYDGPGANADDPGTPWGLCRGDLHKRPAFERFRAMP